MEIVKTNVLVLGGGPGGYVAAIRAGQLGLETTLVESAALGGTCLNVGCVPSKALIHAAAEYSKIASASSLNELGIETSTPRLEFDRTIQWKDRIVEKLNSGVAGLLKRANVRVITGHGVMQDGKTCRVEHDGPTTLIKSEQTILATGSCVTELPILKFGGRVISSTQALSLGELPGRLIVVGGGYIGLELGGAFARLGSSVRIIEAAERVLAQYDSALTQPVVKSLAAQGVELVTNARVVGGDGDLGIVRVADEENVEHQFEADKILVTIGRHAQLEGWGVESLELDMSHGFIRVDDQCQTEMRGVWAVGDVTGEPMLAHRAMAQGAMVAEIIAGEKRAFDHMSIPAICFTDPDIVHAGRPYSVQDENDDSLIVKAFPFVANARAMTMQDDAGFVRITARSDNHLVLGIQAVGAGISELSASFSLALEMGATLSDLIGTIHAHPTRSEALHEAALMSMGGPLHI